MTSPGQALNENFFYNSMLARALVQLIPANQRGVIRAWLSVLHEMDESTEQMQIRNEYMWFLLLMLQNKRLQSPFNKAPPAGYLRRLNEILAPDVYEDVLMTTDQNMSWLENVGGDEADGEYVKPPPPSMHPAEFFYNQPTPKQGVVCYLAAFSDHHS